MLKEIKATDKGRKKVNNFKEQLNSIIETMGAEMEEGRYKSIFMTKIEEASMFGTRAILEKKANRNGEVKF